ncbi:DNA alkylation repair protein [Myroides sp. N17-2]|uniref:DNA alkylation repair protein n=1 Tax=Myroides sp. N17-2 TaxID=2030799 RepID=UPI000EFAD5B6|nr:DNA alkylation repair protein [Myroides sp. N17-2]
MKDILNDVRQTLQDHIEPERVLISDRFFKENEKAKVYGVSKEILSKIGRELYNDLKGQPKEEVYALCNELWKSLYFEEGYIACILTKKLLKQYEAKDIKHFRLWLEKYVQNWASCDTLCCSTIGPLLIKFPSEVYQLTQWASSTNRWMLKEACRLHQEEVYDFIMEHKVVMPRTTLRYAIEKMPFDLKANAMKR